jgi:hypothetical protein
MKASEYQVSVPPHLKDFNWDGRGQTSLDWQKFKNKLKEQRESNNAIYYWRRTINDATRSVRDVSASTEIRCKDIMIKMSGQKDGEVDYVTNLQRRARTFLADFTFFVPEHFFLRTKSPLNF